VLAGQVCEYGWPGPSSRQTSGVEKNKRRLVYAAAYPNARRTRSSAPPERMGNSTTTGAYTYLMHIRCWGFRPLCGFPSWHLSRCPFACLRPSRCGQQCRKASYGKKRDWSPTGLASSPAAGADWSKPARFDPRGSSGGYGRTEDGSYDGCAWAAPDLLPLYVGFTGRSPRGGLEGNDFTHTIITDCL
jgi:hypothetical protein